MQTLDLLTSLPTDLQHLAAQASSALQAAIDAPFTSSDIKWLLENNSFVMVIKKAIYSNESSYERSIYTRTRREHNQTFIRNTVSIVPHDDEDEVDIAETDIEIETTNQVAGGLVDNRCRNILDVKSLRMLYAKRFEDLGLESDQTQRTTLIDGCVLRFIDETMQRLELHPAIIRIYTQVSLNILESKLPVACEGHLEIIRQALQQIPIIGAKNYLV